MKAAIACLLAVLACAVPAQAAYHYSTTIRFSGTFVSEEYDAGTVITRVTSHATWSVHDPSTVVTVQRGAYALFPSGKTRARLSVTQSGYQTVCTATQQTFSDALTRQPKLSWFTLKRTSLGARLGFGWSGELVNRSRSAASEAGCTEPGGVEAGGGNADEAGNTGMFSRFGVRILLSNSRLLAGRSIVKRLSVSRTHSDMLDGTGLVETLTGTYTVLLSRVS